MTGTPKSFGYRFPAEWEKHEATWLTYPVHEASFPGKMDKIIRPYHQFIRFIATSEKVKINVQDRILLNRLETQFAEEEMDLSSIEFYINPSDDVWCRDHGPCFVVNPLIQEKKAVVNWIFNAWGNKYPSENDNKIAESVAGSLGLPVFHPGICMEGGSVDFNGEGTILTTEACLLNPNRNPGMKREQIEKILCEYYGGNKILWLGDGIEGDDTDGHVDDMTRFVSPDTVVTAVEKKKNDGNYLRLQNNLKRLSTMRLASGKQINIAEIPMPDPVFWEGQRLPASYANFYLTNNAVIVPTYQCKKDDQVLDILGDCFPERRVVGIDSTDIVWGFGSFHCLSQQEPFV
jgi:agmatine deiminase